ncbi:hypothetical protein J1N35_043615 [Gossypium stocksii]|uniref:Uncharacterized protein n=1 Tax=Gossypium stocksii TaxID=47602 RepID=A0A9D3U7R1_9ROSI|nr:hypothetical protein J1N35_043615 [Gossypium stocksii]
MVRWASYNSYVGQSGETLEELSASPGRVTVHESEVNVVLPASGSDNPEVGTKVLTQVVREVLEKVFEASLGRNKELVQGKRVDYWKKRGYSPSRLELQSVKCVKMQWGDGKGAGSETLPFHYQIFDLILKISTYWWPHGYAPHTSGPHGREELGIRVFGTNLVPHGHVADLGILVNFHTGMYSGHTAVSRGHTGV